MLASLSIRNIVLIDKLDLEFDQGLCVLTGETGAGKSILLDSLALALGARADTGLIRAGEEKGIVSAEFSLPSDHPVYDDLGEIEVEPGEPLLLRRVISQDGRNRASINSQPVSATLLKLIGEKLVEIHGQNAERGLLDARGHRAVLDLYGSHSKKLSTVKMAFETYQRLAIALRLAEKEIEKAREDEEYLRHVVSELESLSPQEGEEEELAQLRSHHMHAEKIAEALKDANKALTDNGGLEGKVRTATRAVERVLDKASNTLGPVLDSLERAAIELSEASMIIDNVGRDLDMDPAGLEHVEERLFALRAAARKHKSEVAKLPAILVEFQNRLKAVEFGDARVNQLREELAVTKEAFKEKAEDLSTARKKASVLMDRAVMTELVPLKLGNAKFKTLIMPVLEENWSQFGMDKIEFQIATNPGSSPGPLIKVASGGELSRFMLALKVVLAQSGSAPTLVFDEVDRGVGGATADAVGERLSRLSDELQVLVITHSPQVAAVGRAHWNIFKGIRKEATYTSVERLSDGDRLEEIARMLSGANITDEARAAAQSLIKG
jgi:DNA repair protein RecN (Recombination protein N)